MVTASVGEENWSCGNKENGLGVSREGGGGDNRGVDGVGRGDLCLGVTQVWFVRISLIFVSSLANTSSPKNE